MVLTFTGDLSITGSFIEKIERNEEIFSTPILSELKNSDHVVTNLEGPVTRVSPKFSTNVKFKSPRNSITYLSSRNIKVFNLANNHILDCKSEGLIDTIKNIKKNNCKYFGAGNHLDEATKSCILEDGTLKIALIGLTVKSVNNKNEDTKVCTSQHLNILKENIYSFKNKVDFIVLNYHGGEEFTNYPSPTKRRFLRKLSKIKGVDIVICHHSHTLQAYEKYNGKYIFYSLGNFIFDIPAHYPYKYTKNAALLKLIFFKKKIDFNLIPFSSENGNIIDSDVIDFKNYFNTISDFNNYKQKWRAEAYRVLFRYNLIPQKIKPFNNQKTLQEKTFIELLFSKKFYLKIIKILFSNNKPIYISAIIHKLTLKYKLR